MFDGYHFYLFENFGKPTAAQISRLLESAGAQIIPNIGTLSQIMHGRNEKLLVVGDPIECSNLEKDQGIIEKFAFVQTEWIYCSISAFEPLDYRHYQFL